VRVNDVSQDQRYVSTATIPHTRSELVLPLQVGETLLGALDIQCNRPDAFTGDDVRVFQSLADQVAVAMENATRYQAEHSRRLLTEMLVEVNRALSQTLHLEEVLNLILEDLARIVPFDRGSVMLKRDHQLEIVAARGFPPTSNPLQIYVDIKENDVFQQICHSKQPLIVPEVFERDDWQQVEGLPQARSWAGVPLIDAKDEVIGMLSLTRETPVAFAAEEGGLAMAFAGQAAIALQNARLYSDLEQAYEQLERLDKTKADFIYVASHELRTPLTVMQGYSQILLQNQGSVDDAMHSEMLQGIYKGALRLNDIIDSMLDVAKIDASALQLFILPISVLELLQELLRELRDVFTARQLTVSIQDWGDVPNVEADPEALKKVFSHLLVNAVKYTPDGGAITISGRAVPAKEHGLAEGGIEVVITDTGIGIAPRARDLIFDKFYQTGEMALHSSGTTTFKGGGPGLGLAIVKGIVEAHGGRVWAESAGYDEVTYPGSSFYVVLPRHQVHQRSKRALGLVKIQPPARYSEERAQQNSARRRI
jgi:signal transduction histidine kinase